MYAVNEHLEMVCAAAFANASVLGAQCKSAGCQCVVYLLRVTQQLKFKRI